jgi:A/G-specific adenine glycosylase
VKGPGAKDAATTGVKGPARAALLAFFDAEARDLPWRRTKDPYAIWVSEVMLQQTRVDTVIPYYLRFLQRFPTISALAEADEDAVLSHWSGLGYYRRARQLHAAAKVMEAEHGGKIPEDRAARLRLPGIGAYTAGAIGSIAFDLSEPIVDGNVARVLSRVHDVRAPLGSKESETALTEHATRWAHGPRPGALNQALMELGATVCTPSQPACDRCPIATWCSALRDDRVALLPVPRVRRAPKEQHLVAVHASHGDRVMLLKSEVELFGGLYGLPSIEVPEDASPTAMRRKAKALLTSHGMTPTTPLSHAGQLVHVLTHRRLTVELFSASVTQKSTQKTTKKETSARPFSPAELKAVGVSTLAKKLLALVETGLASRRRA